MSGTESLGKDIVSVVTPHSCKFESLQLESGNSDEEVREYVKSTKSQTPEVSASAKATIKKLFSTNPRLKLPMGHPVIALSQEQMYEVLNKVSGESGRESYSMMKGQLLRAGQLRSGKAPNRRGVNSSSV